MPLIWKVIFMCRSLANGGRRCPCQSDPGYKEAQKKRAKELREARKLGLPAPPLKDGRLLPANNTPHNAIKHTDTPVIQLPYEKTEDGIYQLNEQAYQKHVEAVRTPTILFNLAFNNTENNDDTIYFSDEVFTEKTWGSKDVYATLNDGEAVEKGLASPYTMHGSVYDFDGGTVNSTAFSFMGSMAHTEASTITKTAPPVSISEHQRLSQISGAVIQSNLGDAYTDTSDSAYSYALRNHVQDPVNDTITETLESGSKFKNTEVGREAKARVEKIDQYLKNAPKYQKVVYHTINANELQDRDNKEPLDNWLSKKNMVVGQEVTFGNYMNATMDKKQVANRRSFDDENVVLEILTSEGANMSEHDSPGNYLLPRDSHYLVVDSHTGYHEGNTTRFIRLVAIDNNSNILDGVKQHEPKPL